MSKKMSSKTAEISFALKQLKRGSKNESDYAHSILEFFGLGQEHRFAVFAYVFKKMDLPGYIEEHMDQDSVSKYVYLEVFNKDGEKILDFGSWEMPSKLNDNFNAQKDLGWHVFHALQNEGATVKIVLRGGDAEWKKGEDSQPRNT